MPDDPLSSSLTALARRQSGHQQWQNAIQDYQGRAATIPQRAAGLARGATSLAGLAWNASLPAQLRDMYRDLQAGARPEDLAGRSFDAAMRMLDYGVAMPGAGIPKNALGSLTMRRTGELQHEFGSVHSVDFLNASGERTLNGTLGLSKDGTRLHFSNLHFPFGHPLENSPRGAIGIAEIRGLLPELRKQFPTAKRLTFDHTTGARATAGAPRGQIEFDLETGRIIRGSGDQA